MFIYIYNHFCTTIQKFGVIKDVKKYTARKKIIWSLLILYFCSLIKKLSVYNFNGRFIWTVRDRITTQNPDKCI